jgi:hypothetical protein
MRVQSVGIKLSQIRCMATLRISICSHPHWLHLHCEYGELRKPQYCTVPAAAADSGIDGSGHGCGRWTGPRGPIQHEYFHVLRHRFLSGNKDRVKQILPGMLAIFYLHYWWCFSCPPSK